MPLEKLKSCTANLEIFHTLSNIKFHYCARNNLPLVPILIHSILSHTICKSHFILFSCIWLDFPRGLILSAFLLNSASISHVSHVCHLPLHRIYTDTITLKVFGSECTNSDALLSISITSLHLPFPL